MTIAIVEQLGFATSVGRIRAAPFTSGTTSGMASWQRKALLRSTTRRRARAGSAHCPLTAFLTVTGNVDPVERPIAHRLHRQPCLRIGVRGGSRRWREGAASRSGSRVARAPGVRPG
jgi:hypothetical protein